MEASLILTVSVALTLQATSVSGLSPTKREAHFRRCQKGDGVFSGGNVIKTMTSPHVRCFGSCSQDDNCRSLNVCPSDRDEDESTCQLLDRYSPRFCENLDAAGANAECFHAEKTSSCGRGRLGANGKCVCDFCYKGDKCDTHVRDCLEAAQVLAPGSGHDLTEDRYCWVKPTSAPSPFRVKCRFPSNQTNLFLRVQDAAGDSILDWASQPWNKYKRGLDALYNRLVGLENLHYFLGQAEYRLNLYTQFHTNEAATNSYRNLTIGTEAERFALAYDLHTDNVGDIEPETESFKDSKVPHVFCTQGNDKGDCARTNGPGWYFVDGMGGCVGNSPFAKSAKWPFLGKGLLPIHQIEFNVERIADFY